MRNFAPALALIFIAGALGCSSASKKPPSISPPTAEAPSPPSGQLPEAESREGEWDGAKTPEEKRDGLDEELDESLREFDEMLSRTHQQTNERQAQAAASGGQGAGGGLDGELDGTGGTGEVSQAAGGDNSGRVGSPGGAAAPGDGSAASAPKDIPDGSDDDIVARQLREAAQQEADPELREKLWDEYRKYKTGKGKDKGQDEADESSAATDTESLGRTGK